MNTNKIYHVLHKVQCELKAPKNQYNSFGKYNYRSCEDILEGLKKIIPEGCFVSLSDEVVLIGERYYVQATATLICEDGSSHSVRAYAREAMDKKGMDDSQITGTASSYARKYALNGLFSIDDTKDADTQDNTVSKIDTTKNSIKYKKSAPIAAQPPKVADPKSALIDNEKVFELSQLLFNARVNTKTALERYGVSSYEELTIEQFEDCKKKCQERIQSLNAS